MYLGLVRHHRQARPALGDRCLRPCKLLQAPSAQQQSQGEFRANERQRQMIESLHVALLHEMRERQAPRARTCL